MGTLHLVSFITFAHQGGGRGGKQGKLVSVLVYQHGLLKGTNKPFVKGLAPILKMTYTCSRKKKRITKGRNQKSRGLTAGLHRGKTLSPSQTSTTPVRQLLKAEML